VAYVPLLSLWSAAVTAGLTRTFFVAQVWSTSGIGQFRFPLLPVTVRNKLINKCGVAIMVGVSKTSC